MYNYIVILKGSNKDLASFELKNLWEIYFNEKIKLIQIDNTYFKFKSKNKINKDHKIFQRITFTNNLFLEIISTESLETFKNEITKEKLKFINGKTFSIKIKKINKKLSTNNFQFKEYTKHLWLNLENPKVDLENPEINLLFFHNDYEKENTNNKLKLAFQIFENKKKYLTRMPKLRPIKKPYTLKSDMARIAFNYLNIKEGLVLDPFAGIGGILLEGYDMGFKIHANDINWNDLNHLKTNFDYYFKNSKNKYTRTLADSTTQFLKLNSIDGIVTDIPYGKSCRRLGNDLYEGFLKSAKIYLKPGKRLVIIYANFLEFKKLAIKYFDEIIEIEEFINKSMTRHILVLENKK